jgi:hypothetical protein
MACSRGKRALSAEDGTIKVEDRVPYDPHLVKKAIHVIRDPLDNIVARFNNEFNIHRSKNDLQWINTHSLDKNGFRKWCRELDRQSSDLAKQWRWIDKKLTNAFKGVPCYAEFFRYVQWHNNAFAVSRDMGLPTLILHYSDYRDNIEDTIERLLTFLELPRLAGEWNFVSGKEYHDYYTAEERRAAEAFIKEFATAETWHHLKEYDFE